MADHEAARASVSPKYGASRSDKTLLLVSFPNQKGNVYQIWLETKLVNAVFKRRLSNVKYGTACGCVGEHVRFVAREGAKSRPFTLKLKPTRLRSAVNNESTDNVFFITLPQSETQKPGVLVEKMR